VTGMESVEEFIAVNRRNYHAYRDALSKFVGLRLLSYNETERCNYQYVVVEILNEFPLTRDEVIMVLHAENVLARKYFWPGCHNMMPYRALNPHAGMLLKNTMMVAERVIVLPTGTSVTPEKIDRIISALRRARADVSNVKKACCNLQHGEKGCNNAGSNR